MAEAAEAAEAAEGSGGGGGDGGGPGRAALLAAVVDAFLEKLLAAGSYERFAHCYRRFYRAQPHVTRSIHEQLLAQLRTAVTEEIQEVKKEGNLEELFRALDAIVEESRGSEEPAWRPSGIPEADARSALVPFLLKQRCFLSRELSRGREENRAAAAAVLEGRERIAALRRDIAERRAAWQALSREQRALTAALQPLQEGRTEPLGADTGGR
ncbi:polyamine-modulated factor 1 isoform X2 [Tympanuchus pallidicinctus]|uniref:polyamine-modulated factor 1 isoform X2 n=1 Tax=Tympanuchus pallidicinctus TaxID=109042 RepID=UPI002286E5C1|nr:polyamine-modulated factor 1 isoform X2 [Tympanuchus pallidicinctus]